MKLRSAIPALLLVVLTAGSLPAVELALPTPVPVPASANSADVLWRQIEEARRPLPPAPTREEMLTAMRKSFLAQIAAGEEFVRTFPEEPRRFSAKLISLKAAIQLGRYSDPHEPGRVPPESIRSDLQALVASEAPDNIKEEAAFLRLVDLAWTVDDAKPATVMTYYDATRKFLATYKDSKMGGQIRGSQLQLATRSASEAATAFLKEAAAGEDPQLAEAAAGILKKRETMALLKSEPVPLKFTAADGSEVDVKSLRGKVVLIDFWASWCGPCMGEMPNVVATYQKLQKRGFEVIGVSLDQDKDAMEAAMQKLGMTWPQYFDGEGFGNKISSAFGIDSIPAAWLVDKKGMLRRTDVRGEELAAGVEKLLAE